MKTHMRSYALPVPAGSYPVLLALALLTAPPAAAQSTIESAGSRAAQFVLVIDDSGSMARPGAWGEAADADRLSVFAVRSLINMLDDADEVSLVRLNGALAGESPPPIRPLRVNRRQILDLLQLEGRLAQYDGNLTPCRSALSQVEQLLNAAYRPDVAQVVMLLTDGACTGDENPDVDALLGNLRAHQEKLFRFYLLRFRGRESTPALARLARESGGQAIEVGAEDPTALLEPFADALTRSQGYEAELLTPSRFRLAAHRGARRVRLLAVARGEGPELGFTIADQEGRQPALVSDLRTGRHQYQNGRVYRFAALDYLPGTTPVNVRITGAGSDWKIVAVPEYRLFARMEIHRGSCGAPGERAEFVETGGTICALVTIENEAGDVVSGDVTGTDVQAEMFFSRADEPEAGSQPMNQIGNQAKYGFEYRNIERGLWALRPVVHLQLAGQTGELRARSRSLQATSIEIRAEPARIELGNLLPGDAAPSRSIRFKGNFQPTSGRIELADRSNIPACVVFELSGKAEGEPQPITDNQVYSLTLRVAPYCGPETFKRQFETSLRLDFDATTGGQYLPVVEVPVRFQLTHRIEVPNAVELHVRAGEPVNESLEVGSNATRPAVFDAVLEPSGKRAGWPHKDLALGFAPADGKDLLRASNGEVAEAHALTFDPATGGPAALTLRVDSDACCAGGVYETKIGLRPADLAAYSPALSPPKPVFVPVRVRVDSSGLWACRGSLILWILALLLLLLLVLYVVLMFRNSRFLSREHLAKSLTPLRWDTYGGVTRHAKSQQEVRDLVRRSMPLAVRIKAWLKANPLVFGLPGRAYHETAELLLQPERRADKSRISLVAERDHWKKLQADPARGAGRLYAGAQRGHAQSFYAVPRQGCRIGRLVPERLLDLVESDADATRKPRVLKLKRREKLIYPIPEEERDEGRAAGWQIG